MAEPVEKLSTAPAPKAPSDATAPTTTTTSAELPASTQQAAAAPPQAPAGKKARIAPVPTNAAQPAPAAAAVSLQGPSSSSVAQVTSSFNPAWATGKRKGCRRMVVDLSISNQIHYKKVPPLASLTLPARIRPLSVLLKQPGRKTSPHVLMRRAALQAEPFRRPVFRRAPSHSWRHDSAAIP